LVIGDETKSNLPDNLFDLIILNNTFHEFSQPEVMIQDLATKLKQDGRIVIREKFSNSEWTIEHNGCRIEAYKAAEVVGFFENEGMFLTKSWLPEFSTLNYLTFEKNENKGKEYRLQQVGIAKGLETLSLLNSKKVLKDSKKLEEVQNVLIEELPRLTEAYPNLPKFFHELAEYYVEKHKLNRALEVLNILDALFPNDVVSPAIKGDIYCDFGLSEEASDEYGIAIRRAPDDVFNYANLVFSLKESSLYELGIEAYVSGSKIDTTEAYLHSAIGYLFLEMVNYFECPYSIESKEIQDLYVSVIEEDDALRFALEAFNKAIVLQPLEPEYLHSRAKVYVAMADYENAIKDYNKILYLNPYDLFVYRLRADAKLDSGDEAGHDADLQKLKSVRKGLKN
jgi:tetratricopeptide (TPR) repeat protein